MKETIKVVVQRHPMCATLVLITTIAAIAKIAVAVIGVVAVACAPRPIINQLPPGGK